MTSGSNAVEPAAVIEFDGGADDDEDDDEFPPPPHAVIGKSNAAASAARPTLRNIQYVQLLRKSEMSTDNYQYYPHKIMSALRALYGVPAMNSSRRG